MSRLYFGIGALLALILAWWFLSDHFIKIGRQLCAGVDSAALAAELKVANESLRKQAARNAELEAQHTIDLHQMQADAAASALALAHVRVPIRACPAVPATAAAAGGEFGGPGAFGGDYSTGHYEVDFSSVTSDLEGCADDAAELKLLKGWARSVIKQP